MHHIHYFPLTAGLLALFAGILVILLLLLQVGLLHRAYSGSVLIRSS